MLETGSCEQRNTEIGLMAFILENPKAQPCFAAGIRGSARPTLGKKARFPQSRVLLRGRDVSSLVIDTLCDWAVGRNAAVACFYFDFASQKEQSPTTTLSSLLRQVVGGLEEVPAKIVQAFRDQKKATGGRRLGLTQVVDLLQDISSSRRTFICIDALDECMAEYRAKLLDSLEQIVHKSPSTRIFLAGRLHIRDEVEKHLTGKVVAVSITPTEGDIILFLRAELKEDTTPEAMDEGLEEDIIKSIPETVSEM